MAVKPRTSRNPNRQHAFELIPFPTLPVLGTLLLLMTLWTRPLPAQSTELRWRFEPGQTFTVQLQQQIGLESEFDLAKQKIETNSQMTCRWSVESVGSDGVAEIDLTFQRIVLDLTTPTPKGSVRTVVDTGDAGSLDNAKKGKEVAQAILANLRAVLGEPIRVQISPRGELREVRLSEAMKTAVREAPQAMQIKALLSEEGLRGLLAQAAPLLPQEPVEPGASWQAPTEIVLASRRFQRELTSTYIGREDRDGVPTDRIDFTAQLSPLEPSEDSSAAKSIQIVSQTTTGTIWFDSAAGRLQSAIADTTLETDTPYREKFIRVRMTSQTRVDVGQ